MNDVVSMRRDEFEGGEANSHVLMCECPDQTCDSMLELSRPDLESARTDASWYVVHESHVSDAAKVVRVGDGHAVVQYGDTGNSPTA